MARAPIRPHVIVIGGSAGGVDALRKLLVALPHTLPAPLFVVMHSSPGGPGLLPQVLGRSSALPVAPATDGTRPRPGWVYVAPPDYHLLLARGYMRLSHGPREHGFRPAIDPLFRSAAAAYRGATIGILLSGMLDDGTLGLMRIKAAGGVALVQDPDEALMPGMPRSALQNVEVDHALPVAGLAQRLVYLSTDRIRSRRAMAPDTIKTTPPAGGAAERDPRIVPAEPAGELARAVLPAPPVLTCPACGGALQEDQERDLARYVCHVGHAYSPHALAAAEDERIEAALWSAVRALKERAELHHRLAQHARTARLTGLVRKTQETAADMEARAATIVKMLLQSNSPPATERRPPRAPAARQRATPARTRPRRPRPAGRAGSPRPRRKAGRRR